jgi:hypothetical protein
MPPEDGCGAFGEREAPGCKRFPGGIFYFIFYFIFLSFFFDGWVCFFSVGRNGPVAPVGFLFIFHFFVLFYSLPGAFSWERKGNILAWLYIFSPFLARFFFTFQNSTTPNSRLSKIILFFFFSTILTTQPTSKAQPTNHQISKQPTKRKNASHANSGIRTNLPVRTFSSGSEKPGSGKKNKK